MQANKKFKNVTSSTLEFKVKFFWEGHTNLSNLPHGLDICLVTIQTMRKVAQIFVSFSEKLNFIAWNISFLSVARSYHLHKDLVLYDVVSAFTNLG